MEDATLPLQAMHFGIHDMRVANRGTTVCMYSSGSRTIARGRIPCRTDHIFLVGDLLPCNGRTKSLQVAKETPPKEKGFGRRIKPWFRVCGFVPLSSGPSPLGPCRWPSPSCVPEGPDPATSTAVPRQPS